MTDDPVHRKFEGMGARVRSDTMEQMSVFTSSVLVKHHNKAVGSCLVQVVKRCCQTRVESSTGHV